MYLNLYEKNKFIWVLLLVFKIDCIFDKNFIWFKNWWCNWGELKVRFCIFFNVFYNGLFYWGEEEIFDVFYNDLFIWEWEEEVFDVFFNGFLIDYLNENEK